MVIGAAGLLGKKVTQSLLEAGNKVVLADLHLDALQQVQLELDYKGENSTIETVDITDSASLDNLIASSLNYFRKIDSVVNCAYPRNSQYGEDLENVSFSSFCENVNLHLGGYFLAAQRFGIAFKHQGFGHLVSLSSIYGLVAPKFEVYEGTEMTMPVEYAAIKSGVIHLTKYFAQYYKSSKVRFNSVAPGGIFNNQPESFVANYSQHSQSGSMLSVDQVAKVIRFLISAEASGINGQVLVVDDGWTL